MGIALVVTCILAYVFSKKITRPIEKLSDTVSQMAKGQYDTRAKIKTDGEVGDLVNSFNIMADRLEKNIEELEDTARRRIMKKEEASWTQARSTYRSQDV